MNISPIQSPAGLSGLSLEQLAKNPHVSEKDKVEEVARQFESYLLRVYLGEARKTLVNSNFLPEGSGNHVYHDMMTSQLADTMSRSGSLGLAEALGRELEKQAVKPPLAEGSPGQGPSGSTAHPGSVLNKKS